MAQKVLYISMMETLLRKDEKEISWSLDAINKERPAAVSAAKNMLHWFKGQCPSQYKKCIQLKAEEALSRDENGNLCVKAVIEINENEYPELANDLDELVEVFEGRMNAAANGVQDAITKGGGDPGKVQILSTGFDAGEGRVIVKDEESAQIARSMLKDQKVKARKNDVILPSGQTIVVNIPARVKPKTEQEIIELEANVMEFKSSTLLCIRVGDSEFPLSLLPLDDESAADLEINTIRLVLAWLNKLPITMRVYANVSHVDGEKIVQSYTLSSIISREEMLDTVLASTSQMVERAFNSSM